MIIFWTALLTTLKWGRCAQGERESGKKDQELRKREAVNEKRPNLKSPITSAELAKRPPKSAFSHIKSTPIAAKIIPDVDRGKRPRIPVFI